MRVVLAVVSSLAALALATSCQTVPVSEFEPLIKDLNSTGLTILMVEQNARQGLAASHRGYVLELGREKFEGSAKELLDSPEMAKLYLGGSTEDGESYRRKAKTS